MTARSEVWVSRVLLGVFFIFVSLPTLPLMLLFLSVGRLAGWTDVGYGAFIRDWLLLRIIP